MSQAEDLLDREDLAFSISWVEVEEGVKLRLLSWRPKREQRRPVLFVAGWVSALQGWLDLIRGLTETRAVFYLESREKSSARMTRERPVREDFTIERMALDIIETSRTLPAGASEHVLMGSSLGATSILEAAKHGRLRPHAAFLIGPNARFRFPWWGVPIIHLPAASYRAIQPLIRWYLRFFRVDARREPEQMERYDATLKQAHPLRIKLSAQAVRGYRIWPDLDTIECPLAIAYAKSDSLHSAEELNHMGRAMPGAVMVPCPSNRFMHSAEMIARLDEFLEGLSVTNRGFRDE